MAAAVVYFQLALIFMSVASTPLETGYYGVAFRVVDLANGVPWLLVTSAFPILARAARDDRDRLRYAMQRLFDVALILGGWFSMSLVLGARFIVDVVAGPASHASIPVLQTLGGATLATFLIATWSFGLLSVRGYRSLLIANLIAITVQVVATLPLASTFGAQGAAVGAAVTEVVLAAAYGIALVRQHPELRPQLGVARRTVVAVAVAAPVGVVGLLVHPVLAVAVASATYFATLALLRAIPRELVEAIARR
jgi:O-antigen/teichoic acid export membrane protein